MHPDRIDIREGHILTIQIYITFRDYASALHKHRQIQIYIMFRAHYEVESVIQKWWGIHFI